MPDVDLLRVRCRFCGAPAGSPCGPAYGLAAPANAGHLIRLRDARRNKDKADTSPRVIAEKEE